MTLDERKKIILESIIKDYVETAEPVGSRAVVRKHDLRISAATVRNEMADLEEMGYLEQPHTSAGRIPSQVGFRYFVDCMMEKEAPTEADMKKLVQSLNENSREWNEVAQQIGTFLSQITNYTSFVIVPALRVADFKYIQLIPIDQHRALVLVVAEPGLIMHRQIDVPESLEAEDFKKIGQQFTSLLGGKKMSEVGRSDLKLLVDRLKQKRKLIDRVLETVDSLLNSAGGDRVVVSGALNILNEPEFKDVEKIRRILALLDENEKLKTIIPEQMGDKVDIRIGKENQVEDIKEMSLVYAGYKTLGEMGKIGVIGPVRMEYWKAAGSVETVRDLVEEILKRF